MSLGAWSRRRYALHQWSVSGSIDLVGTSDLNPPSDVKCVSCLFCDRTSRVSRVQRCLVRGCAGNRSLRSPPPLSLIHFAWFYGQELPRLPIMRRFIVAKCALLPTCLPYNSKNILKQTWILIEMRSRRCSAGGENSFFFLIVFAFQRRWNLFAVAREYIAAIRRHRTRRRGQDILEIKFALYSWPVGWPFLPREEPCAFRRSVFTRNTFITCPKGINVYDVIIPQVYPRSSCLQNPIKSRLVLNLVSVVIHCTKEFDVNSMAV